MLVLQRSIRAQTIVLFEQSRVASFSKLYQNILIAFLLFNRHKKQWASATLLCQERGVIPSETIFASLLRISPVLQREVGNGQSPELAAFSLGSSRPAPSCHIPLGAREEERQGGRWPSPPGSHPIPSCYPVRWDTRSSGERSSLRAITGFTETSLPSSGMPENQAQWSYTGMCESRLGPWLFSFIVSCWWCNMTNLLGITALHSNIPLSEVASLQSH